VVSLPAAEDRVPLIVPALIVIAPVGIGLPAILLLLVGVLAPLIIGPAHAPEGVAGPAILLWLFGRKARAPSIVPAAIAAAPVGVIAAAALLPIVGVEALPPGVLRITLEPGGRR